MSRDLSKTSNTLEYFYKTLLKSDVGTTIEGEIVSENLDCMERDFNGVRVVLKEKLDLDAWDRAALQAKLYTFTLEIDNVMREVDVYSKKPKITTKNGTKKIVGHHLRYYGTIKEFLFENGNKKNNLMTKTNLKVLSNYLKLKERDDKRMYLA